MVTIPFTTPQQHSLTKPNSMALMALRMMQESAKHPAPLKYPKKVYSVFDDPDVRFFSCCRSSVLLEVHVLFSL
jgi:hypothetical protein